MVDSGDNHEIVSIVIIFNWNLMLRGGFNCSHGIGGGQARVLISISQFRSITTFYPPTYDLLQSPSLFGG